MDKLRVKRKRFEGTIVYFDDGKGDDYVNVIVNAVVHDGMALIDIEITEDVELVPKAPK